MNPDPERLWQVIAMLPLFLFSLTIHEFAHAWSAKRFGDPTAEQEGRLTIDPRAHIDPLGLFCFLLSAWAGFGFGWAKPVPVRLGNCRNPLQAMFWVAAAGPISNLLQGLAAVLLLLLLGLAGAASASAVVLGVQPIFESSGLSLLDIVACLLGYYLQINLILMLFNLIPVPPLDGGRILVSILPPEAAQAVAGLERYGFMILLGLMYFGLVGTILGTPMQAILGGLLRLFVGLGFA